MSHHHHTIKALAAHVADLRAYNTELLTTMQKLEVRYPDDENLMQTVSDAVLRGTQLDADSSTVLCAAAAAIAPLDDSGDAPAKDLYPASNEAKADAFFASNDVITANSSPTVTVIVAPDPAPINGSAVTADLAMPVEDASAPADLHDATLLDEHGATEPLPDAADAAQADTGTVSSADPSPSAPHSGTPVAAAGEAAPATQDPSAPAA
jgi:hypothetical protein